MTHVFDVDVAIEFGVGHAIVINNFQHWIIHNKSNNRNYNDGRTWTYNSYKALAKIFPYYSDKQVRKIMNDLTAKGVLITGNYNEKEYDNTTWYAFQDEQKWIWEALKKTGAPEGKGIAPQGTPHTLNTQPIDQQGKAIPYTKQHIQNTNAFTTVNTVVNAVPPISPAPVVGENKKSEKKKTAAKKKRFIYTEMIDIYWKWHEDTVGADPVIDKAQGQAMISLEEYILIQTRKKIILSGNAEPNDTEIRDAALSTWQILLNALCSENIEPFYRAQTKLTQIWSNLTLIINQLKNGNPKQQSKQTGGNVNTGAAFNAIDKHFG